MFDKYTAIGYCDRAIGCLGEAQRQLGWASGLGIFDILGGGLLTTFLKHAEYSKAEGNIRSAEHEIRTLADYLNETEGAPHFDGIDIGALLTIADFLFDGFLADFLVQCKIGSTRRRVDDAISTLKSVRMKLSACEANRT